MKNTGATRDFEGGALPLICPVCGLPLSWDDRACRCAQGHSYDVAREGYLNLLLSHHRRSKNSGDSIEMVRARRRFFDSGSFSQVTELIRSEVCGRLAERALDDPVGILDSGCGEGHFLGALEPVVSGSLFGLDVSKEAIRLAARRHGGCRWIVTNAMRTIPFAGDSVNVVLSVLAPRNVQEFARILHPHGHLVLIVPGPDHLVEARSLLMADGGDYQAKADDAVELCAPHFSPGVRGTLTYDVSLNRDLLQDLVQMTPLFWRSTQEAKTRFSALAELRVTMSLVLMTFLPKR